MKKRILSVLFTFVLLFSLRITDGLAAPRAVDEDQYWKFISDARTALDKISDAESPEGREQLYKLANEFQSYKVITLYSGERVSVDNTVLINEMTSYAPNIEKIKAMLDALLNARQKYPHRVFSAKDLATLSTVTSRPEFQWAEAAKPNPLAQWLQELWQKLIQWLGKLMNADQGQGQGSEAGPSPIPFIAAVLLAIIMFFIFRSIFGDLINDARAGDNGDGSQEVLTADAAFERAQSLSRGGDYRSAVRYLYLSSLLMLDERGLLRYDRSKTNREYLKSVANSPELAGPLSEVIDVFDNVWYGFHTLDEETFKHYSARVEELKEKKQ